MSKSNVLAFPSETNSGMTLRDYFAAAVLSVSAKQFYKEQEIFNRLEVAEDAYLIADCMLKVREKE
jgi:hypothetical protein